MSRIGKKPIDIPSGVKVSVEGAEVKVEGKKRPQTMDVDHTYDMDKVKYTKYLINFK